MGFNSVFQELNASRKTRLRKQNGHWADSKKENICRTESI